MHDDTQQPLKQFISRDTRLIFSGIHDSEDDVENWKIQPQKQLRFTWSGYRYFSDLSTSPPYIQWAFDRVKHVSATFWNGNRSREKIVDRLAFAFHGFRIFIDAEKSTHKSFIDAYRKSKKTEAEAAQLVAFDGFECNLPMADVFFRSTPEFIHAMMGGANQTLPLVNQPENAERRRNDPTVANELLSLIELWMDYAEEVLDYIEKYSDSISLIRWQEIFTHIEDERVEFLNVNRQRISLANQLGGVNG